jgi:hypothetical protein
MAVDGPAGARLGFAPLVSLLEAFLIKLIGNFFPLDCVLPAANILVSISARARSRNHII